MADKNIMGSLRANINLRQVEARRKDFVARGSRRGAGTYGGAEAKQLAYEKYAAEQTLGTMQDAEEESPVEFNKRISGKKRKAR